MEYSSLTEAFMATGTHVPYCISQRYLSPAEVTFLHLPQTIKAGTRFSDPDGCKDELT